MFQPTLFFIKLSITENMQMLAVQFVSIPKSEIINESKSCYCSPPSLLSTLNRPTAPAPLAPAKEGIMKSLLYHSICLTSMLLHYCPKIITILAVTTKNMKFKLRLETFCLRHLRSFYGSEATSPLIFTGGGASVRFFFVLLVQYTYSK